MADDFKVEGAEALFQLGRRMKAAGKGDLLKEMNKANAKAVKPVTPASRKRALEILPRKGGLNKRVAKAPQRVTSRVGGTTASVRVTVAGKKSGAAGADRGVVRHPVFGRVQFVDQRVPAGWFSDTTERLAPGIREDVTGVLVEYAERLTGPL